MAKNSLNYGRHAFQPIKAGQLLFKYLLEEEQLAAMAWKKDPENLVLKLQVVTLKLNGPQLAVKYYDDSLTKKPLRRDRMTHFQPNINLAIGKK